jgi:iron(III) transport system substrate-binding protein
VDVFMDGLATTTTVLYPEKMLDPLKPLFLLPDVVDPAKWKTGKPWFVDPEGQYVLRVFSSVTDLLHINTDHVRPEEIRSARDLLNPKWKGKIAIEDPTVPGSGSNQAARFYLQLGEEFVRKLYIDQSPVRTRERRQLTDWLARGTYPICLNCREDDVRALRKEGFKILEIFELADVPASIASAPWLLSVANRAPHPNAARVFVNWIASKEGLETYSRGYGAVTLRRDVDESFLRAETIPRPGVNYFDDSDWKWAVTGRQEARERVWKLLKPR